MVKVIVLCQRNKWMVGQQFIIFKEATRPILNYVFVMQNFRQASSVPAIYGIHFAQRIRLPFAFLKALTTTAL